MCGIAGIISEAPRDDLAERCRAMCQSIAHRGPDGDGFWDDGHSVYFAHRRLTIIDPTPASDQPLIYGDYVLIFNGEIYNYRELKKELSGFGYRFTTTGDSEVIPAAYDKWGINCLHHFEGMFAFALYHKSTHKLMIARDRFGEKPMYFHARYAARGKLAYLFFASEMKALWAAGAPREVNHKMMVNYLGLGYVQNPIVKTDTFFKEILNLPPGYLLLVETNAMRFTMRRWYEPFKRIGHLPQEDVNNEDKVIEKFHELLFNSVKRRLRSDVPVGSSLSGGLDSSSIVAAISQIKGNSGHVGGWANVCFSAIFPGFDKDESQWSKQVADSLGLIRYTTHPEASDLSNHFSEMLHYQEEPVQSSSVFTQYLVYRQAKEEAVSVLLDGQGADEILAGYSKYSHWYLQQLLRKNRQVMLQEKALLLENGMLETWGLPNYIAAWLPWQTAKLLKTKAIRQIKQSPLHPDYVDAHLDTHTLFKPEVRNLEDILYFNTFNMGLEELLRYADRNSMANSREVRLPFLDYELVEFIFSLPAHFKIRAGFGKWLLRKSMERYLPGDVVWRKGKIGFEPPQAKWMQEKFIGQQVQAAEKSLKEMGMLKPNASVSFMQPSHAHAHNNFGWRVWCAEWLFRNQ